MSQYANIKDAFLHCDVDKLILEYYKIPDDEYGTEYSIGDV